MGLGKTTKCENGHSMSMTHTKQPRTGKVAPTGKVYFCRACGAVRILGRESRRRKR